MEFKEALAQVLAPEDIRENEPMARHTTFQTGGNARFYLTPATAEQGGLAMSLCRTYGLPYEWVGLGSNLLVSDEGFPGAILTPEKHFQKMDVQGTLVRAQAGVSLNRLVDYVVSLSLKGLEFAAGIPGSVGGALTMNAGAYDGEMKQVVKGCTVLTAEGQVLSLNAEELQLGYRTSCIKTNGYVVLEGEFQLSPGNREALEAKVLQLKAMRAAKQPLEYGSAGSTFKRPAGYYAGKLIMDSGLAGYSVGQAGVSEKHCGFVINRGNATSAQVRSVIQHVQHTVKDKFGVELEPEVRFIGHFPE